MRTNYLCHQCHVANIMAFSASAEYWGGGGGGGQGLLELVKPIRTGVFQTANEPGEGRFTSLPTISKTIVSIFTISYMCILLGALGMFQLEFFKNLRFYRFPSISKSKVAKKVEKIIILLVCLK